MFKLTPMGHAVVWVGIFVLFVSLCALYTEMSKGVDLTTNIVVVFSSILFVIGGLLASIRDD